MVALRDCADGDGIADARGDQCGWPHEGNQVGAAAEAAPARAGFACERVYGASVADAEDAHGQGDGTGEP